MFKRLEQIASHIRIPLRWKFTVPISMLVFVMGLLTIALLHGYIFDQLLRELEKRGIYIARMLAEQSSPYILYEEYFKLQDLVRSFPEADEDIIYALVIAPDGNIAAHTFTGGFPVDLLGIHPRPLQSPHLVRLKSGGTHLLDIAVPILGGRAGIARVGLNERGVRAAARQNLRALSLLLLPAVLLGLLASFLLARFISHPIVRIAQAMQHTELESKLPELPAHTGDEIGSLIEQFNAMVERLQRAHQRLQAAQKQMLQAQKLEAINELAAGVAHEINNPLDGIRNCLHAIRRGNLSPERQQLYFEMIDEAVQRIEMVVRDLAEHARHRGLHWEALDLNQLFDHCLRQVNDALKRNGVSLQRRSPPGPIWIVGDQLTLEQAFLNLIRNALEAMPDGGTLGVNITQVEGDSWIPEAEKHHAPEVGEGDISPSIRERIQEIGASSGITWMIEIKDTGVGISAEQLSRLFDPFFTTKSSQHARGLGLWVTRGILEMHGGHIEIESEVARGTTCRVFLPGKGDADEDHGCG